MRGVSKACKELWHLEDVIAALVKAQDHLRVTRRRITSRLKTVDEADDLRELEQAQAAIDEAKRELIGWHPSALKRK